MTTSAPAPNSQLSPAVTTLQETLTRFALQDNFLSVMREAFGSEFSEDAARDLQAQWAVGDFSNMPAIEVRPEDAMGGAWGAFASETRTIFLGEEFLAHATPERLVAVLLEEFGHDVDARINDRDSAGDEGEIFSALVRGVELSSDRLAELRNQDDVVVVNRQGTLTALETASLLGESVTVDVRYEVFADSMVNVSLYTGTFTVVAGAELSNQAVSHTFSSGGFPQTLTGTISINVGTNTLAVTFSGTQQGGSIKFIFTSLADQSASSVSAVVETSTSGFTPGVNQPLVPSVSANTVTVGFQPLGYQPGVTINQTSTVTLVDAVGDVTPPTVTSVTSSTANGSYNAGDVIAVQVNFSEAVNVTGTPQLTLETGTTDRVVNYASGSGSSTLNFSYTVQAGDTAADLDYLGTTALALNGGTIKDAAGNNATLTLASPGAAGSLGANKNLVIDTTAPTVTAVTSSTANGTYKAGDIIAIQVSFSETVTVTGTPQLTLETGTTDRVVNYASGSGSNTLTFNYTVQAGDTTADLDYLSTAALALNGGTIRDGAANNATLTLASPGAAGSLGANKNLVIDGVAPTVTGVTSSTANGTYKVGDVVSVQVAFSETVNVTGTPQLTLETGTTDRVVNYASGSGSSTLSFTYTVQAGDTAADLDYLSTAALALNGGTINDAAGNAAALTLASPGAAGSLGANKSLIIDGVAPTVAIASNVAAVKIGETATITFTFSEAPTGFVAGDITTTNGTLTGLAVTGDPKIYTATFTPTTNTAATNASITVAAASYTDAAGNGGGAGTTPTLAVDTQRPTVASIVLTDSALKIGDTSTVTFTFNEAVTGFTTADLTSPSGTLSGLSTADGGTTWTATLTPSAATSDATNSLQLDLTGITDLAGNAGTGTSNSANYQVDTVRPALNGAIVISDTALKIGDTATVTITFTEAVSGFTSADVNVPSGALSALSSADGGITWTATLTPSASTTAATNALTIDLTGINDAAGNAGSGTGTSGNYAVDTVRPVLAAAIAITDTALKIGDTATVTFTFNEAVTGFTTADLTSPGGSLSGLSSADGGITWTGTLTPSAGTTAATNVITLDYTGVADLAGNAGTGSVTSPNYAVDTVRPTASLLVADTSLTVGETSGVTFTFSEAVSGFTAADLTVGSGTITAPSTADGGVTWTATITPSANTVVASNTVVLDNTGITDLAGNAGTGTSVSNTYAVETTRPVFVSASVSGNLLGLTYTDASALDAVNVAANGAFAVTSGGVANPVTGVSVNAAARTITLTLTSAVNFGDVVTLAYTDPTPGNDTNAIQDAAGNDAASFPANTIANITPDPDPPASAPPLPGADGDRDGVPNSLESLVPPLRPGGLTGDGNGDGIADTTQANVVSAPWPTSNRYLTVVADSNQGVTDPDPNGAVVTNFKFPAPAGKGPNGLGLFPTLSFDAAVGTSGQTETFSLFVDANPKPTGFWVQGANGVWTNIATRVETVGDKVRIDFAIADGGPFDADGLANGTIAVAGGPSNVPLSLVGQSPDLPPGLFWF